ncbi:hypothetical protein CKA32_005838 [Geitlerinema sp. FC II]|nr:hypothetical protein CKA32_005838 [Geitlerinema sp. FC II]
MHLKNVNSSNWAHSISRSPASPRCRGSYTGSANREFCHPKLMFLQK